MAYVRVTVTPAAKRERFAATSETEFEVAVKEPAERNLANRRVQALIAEYFGVPHGKVRLISGHRSSRKIFTVEMLQ